ncbi:MAG: hypothetical protein LUF27_01175 [Lachnospiraceae bacterium]|nr:hypothetical protein [Lachnospiraceae bacterium]
MNTERAIASISHWIGCSEKEAEMILNGVYNIGGDNYSAYINENNRLVICKNGFEIHRIMAL